MKTREEIKAEILIHKASGATRKVALLEAELAKGAIKEKAIDLTKPSSPNPIISGDKNKIGDDVLYEYHSLGSTWKEIETLTGVRSAWFRVKKYAKANNKPYPINL